MISMARFRHYNRYKMKVAYVTNYDSEVINHWSGTGYYIAESLKKQGVELVRINCFLKFTVFQRLKRKLIKMVANKSWQIEREASYLKKIAEKAQRELARSEHDIIMAPGSIPVTYLRSDKPIVIFTDATYECLMDLYVKRGSLSGRSIVQGNLAETRALQNAALVFYPSKWAIKSAVEKYKVDPGKIYQIGFGANIASESTADQMRQLIHRRMQQKEKNFLFIGVDWYRKGAKTAIATIARLREMGVSASLTLAGCAIPKGECLPDFVTYYPFISKASKDGQDRLRRLFEKAHFFILPTMADCTPIVFSEAASYGLPVITTDVGGCPSVIIDHVTGFCIKEENFVEDASKKILELCVSEPLYESICLRAYEHYQKELNWDVIGKKAVSILQQLVGPHNLVC